MNINEYTMLAEDGFPYDPELQEPD